MSAAKQKGTAAETAVAAFLRLNGYPAVERRALAGALDRGDIAGLPGVVVEVKNHREMTLSKWVDEANVEASEAEAGVVWHKRPGRGSPGDWYVSMDGWTFLEFLKVWMT